MEVGGGGGSAGGPGELWDGPSSAPTGESGWTSWTRTMARPEDRTGWRPCRLKAAVPESGSVVATAPRRPCPPVSLVLEGTADFTENHLREADRKSTRLNSSH